MAYISNGLRVIGVDIGGSHITAGCMDFVTGSIASENRIRSRINSLGTADEIIDGWVEAIVKACGQNKEVSLKLGIAMPGPFNYEDGVSFIKNMNKYESLYGMNVKQVLAKRLGLPTSSLLFRNDAEAYLHGEVSAGAGKGWDNVIGVTLGTGLGSASYKKGVTRDVNRAVDHFFDGIAEDYISTRWFIKRYFEVTGEYVNDVYQLSQLCSEPLVRGIFDEFGRNLAIFLARFAMYENPKVIVIGGNIANAWHLFESSVQKYFDSNHISIPLKRSLLGEDAALIGAAVQFIDPVILNDKRVF